MALKSLWWTVHPRHLNIDTPQLLDRMHALSKDLPRVARPAHGYDRKSNFGWALVITQTLLMLLGSIFWIFEFGQRRKGNRIRGEFRGYS